jgi:P-type Ca2+ transporter type 2C
MFSTCYNIADLLRQTFKRVFERPFNSETKSMAVSGTHVTSNANVSHLHGSGRELYHIKGSIDALLPRCKFYHVAEGSTPVLDQKVRSGIASKAQAASTRGLRVLAMAYGNADAIGPSRPPSPMPNNTTDYVDKDKSAHLVFAGFVAMYDPPRKGVADAVAHLQRGGVQVIMITGDGDETALSIAKSLGLRGATNPNACLTGSALDRMTAVQLSERVGNVSVFARVSPKHKMAIVEAFQARGAVVAMTGDGGKLFFFLHSLSTSVLVAHGCCDECVAVNDAPALKMADIGVSMGKTGTDVAKEAADVILVDDNFSTILPAVEEGEFSSQNSIIDV